MLEPDTLVAAAGWIGVILIFLGFSLNVLTKVISSESISFLMLNFVGAWLLVVNSYFTGQYHFSILNSFWGVVALVGIVKVFFVSKNKTFKY
ncbi:MAG: hypothetical protein OQJ89_09415 [Kangiellaceae bacterium]|nr:hypothetical protein [Kangiellaceae bacterium]MCW9017171.1 hypothetical protein [Kangiellaceae bacterium]